MFNIKKLLWSLIFVNIAFTITGAYSKITGKTWADIMIEIALISLFSFIALCLIAVFRSKKLNKSEKWLYTFAVTLFPLIGGLFYLLTTKENTS